MFETYRAAAGPVIRTMDRTEWQLHEALPWLEPKGFDGHDEDVYATMQLLLQLINVYN